MMKQKQDNGIFMDNLKNFQLEFRNSFIIGRDLAFNFFVVLGQKVLIEQTNFNPFHRHSERNVGKVYQLPGKNSVPASRDDVYSAINLTLA
jgi:hypothetical protein